MLKRLYWPIFALFCLEFVGLCALQWGQPAIEDEVLMHKGALIWLAKGADWFELSHTPFYLEAVSIWQKIFGAASPEVPERIAVLRSFGVFTSLITVLLFALGSTRSLLALALLIFSPYFIQYSLLLDYDTTVLGPPLLLAAILIERWDQRNSPSWRLALAIGLVLGLALFAKELTPLIFLVLWPAWAMSRGWRHTLQAVLGSLLALLIVFLLLVIWGKIRGFHWYDPLHLSKQKFLGRTADQGSGFFPWKVWGWPRFLFLTYLPVLWVGIPTLYVFSRLRSRIARIPFSIWAAVGIFGAYTWLVQSSFYFPKYTAPAWPLLVFGITQSLGDAKTPTNWVSHPRVWILFFFLFTVGFLSLLDPLLIIENRTNITATAIAAHALALATPLVLLSLLARFEERAAAPVLIVGLILYFLGTDIGQVIRPHQTRYLYGEQGFNETLTEVQKLKAQVSPGEPILSVARDISWRLGADSRYFELAEYQLGRAKWRSKILVSRTYGAYSIAGTRGARREVEAVYPCHATVATPGQRYEWWWQPRPGTACFAK